MISVIFSILLFAIGMSGVLTKRDLPRIIISLSILLGSVALLLVSLQTAQDAAMNQSFVLLLWLVEVMEIIIGVALIVHLRRRGKSNIDEVTELR